MFPPERRMEAMKKPSRAGGGKPSKARSRRPSSTKRNIKSKPAAPRSTATQQVAEWLENLGMSEYAECFAENDVVFSVLPHLTDHDLKELGVSLGHR
jgi:SAM domain (Sterile alpha motif)